MLERRAGELQREPMWIRTHHDKRTGRARTRPDPPSSARWPARAQRGRTRQAPDRRRRPPCRTSGPPGPPAHRDLLGVHRVAHDEVVRRRIGRRTGEQAHRQIERPPPRVDRGSSAPDTERGNPPARARHRWRQ
jgi:hypothetical protein